MNLDDINKILNLMREHDLAEFELERDGLKIRVRKGGQHVAVVVDRRVDARYRIACCQDRKLVTPGNEVSVGAYHESINAPFTDGHERPVDLSLTACRYSPDLQKSLSI